ncbi:MAG TPA: hypothetical protein VHP63_06580 [candidate division Zixibacteria bacterium]|nr:hypothetical protein [candidate division Zixibacteria bacterium]
MYTRIATANDYPIYSSKGNFRNLWQKYHIFRDRVELNTHLLGKFVINFEDLDRVVIRKSNLSQWGVFFRGKVPFVMGVKLDLSDFYDNLGIYKIKGFVKLFVVIPDDLKVFKQYLERAMADFKNKR